MIEVLACGPLTTVQDDGRPGHLAQGLARGGAADPAARIEARALLDDIGAGIETAGAPLTLRFEVSTVVALTGAAMKAECDGTVLGWHAAHPLPEGAVLTLRPMGPGVYSYVHARGGLATPELLGSRSMHLIAGIGAPLQAGDRLPCEATTGHALRIAPVDRFGGGLLRLVPTPQTALFPEAERQRFTETTFTRDPRGNRQGVRLAQKGEGFATEGQLNLLSDFILPGDVQMTGEGVPYILGPECQTMGGYPRIGSVIGADLPRAMQAAPGDTLRFAFVTAAEAAALRPPRLRTERSVRSPSEVPDLMGLQLVGGVVSAKGDE
ncbi:biotin-dependent carboxyltransferase family protein [Jannaschia sp. S6380]|uniref:5-oxoprolinase subunit C family protein n=1 Tax=Jannaschia sp. S6380 TaxID=2926408 RepID=UPI001FF3485F|nr:biotin-dependent carboxyltransferase family protein [Jannaschia sp. S6380]MCK0166098.1 biotin-dependent carboxyltransferase family protein [Jannaschia sp. S6380]